MRVIYLFALAALPGLVNAAPPSAIVLSGAEVSRSNHYAYLGGVLPLPGHRLGKGLSARLWLDGVGYTYDTGPGKRIDATGLGQELALGWQTSTARSSAAVYLGLRHGYLDLDPDDPGNRDRGHGWRGKLQLEGETELAPGWRANLIASHLFGSGNHWARLRLQRSLGNGWLIGPELISVRAPDHQAWQLGGYLGNLRLGEALYLTLKTGARHSEGVGTSAYLGAELYAPF